MTPVESAEDTPPSKRLGRRGQAAVVALLLALVATAGIVRAGGDPGPTLASMQCQTALHTAATLAPFATGALAIFRPATMSQNLGTLAFDDAAGRTVSVDSFSGKTVLLNFWATWCVPCRTEMPALDRLQADRGSDAFQVVAVNLDTDSTAGDEKAFLDQIGVRHLDFYADSALALTRQLKTRGLVFGLPTTILVDDQGCQLGTAAGGAAWDSMEASALVTAAIAGRAGPS